MTCSHKFQLYCAAIINLCYLHAELQVLIIIYRQALFTAASVHKSRNDWVKSLMDSLGKYNLSCYATQTQISEYLMFKYEEFLEKETDDEQFLTKLASKVTGLQEIAADGNDVKEIELDPTAKVWVLNDKVHININGQFIDTANSPFIWLGKLHMERSPTISMSHYASKADPSMTPLPSHACLRLWRHVTSEIFAPPP